MNKCLRVSFTSPSEDQVVHIFIQKQAKSFAIEGTLKKSSQGFLQLIACGKKELVDDFVDQLHKGSKSCSLENIEIEPFLKDRDYRGVFRVIE